MRLLRSTTLHFHDFNERDLPAYAILSHTWDEGELSHQAFNALSPPGERGDGYRSYYLGDIDARGSELLSRCTDEYPMMPGLQKIVNFCRRVRPIGIQWVWIDTCCINKESSTELSEAINSMFDWYKQAQVCYVFLSDVYLSSAGRASERHLSLRQTNRSSHRNLGSKEQPVDLQTAAGSLFAGTTIRSNDDGYDSSDSETGESSFLELIKLGADETSTHDLDSSTISSFRTSRWFRRGWTLQELLAPANMVFFDRSWKPIGTKHELASEISRITGIDMDVILSPTPLNTLSRYTTAQKMSWAANRETTRTEDTAYSLLGIFGIYMPLQYGEGVNAFFRLQRMILETSSDETVLAWNPRYVRGGSELHGIFAEHPRAFLKSRSIEALEIDHDPISITSRGAAFTIFNHASVWENASRLVLPLNCRRNGEIVGISLARFRKVWYRVRSASHNISNLHELGRLSMVPVLPMDPQTRGALYVSLKAPAGAIKNALVDSETMTPCVAIRLTTHMLPWSMICSSIHLAAVVELMGKNPRVVEFQSGPNAKPLGMIDTGKEVYDPSNNTGKEVCDPSNDTAVFKGLHPERETLNAPNQTSFSDDVPPVNIKNDVSHSRNGSDTSARTMPNPAIPPVAASDDDDHKILYTFDGQNVGGLSSIKDGLLEILEGRYKGRWRREKLGEPKKDWFPADHVKEEASSLLLQDYHATTATSSSDRFRLPELSNHLASESEFCDYLSPSNRV